MTIALVTDAWYPQVNGVVRTLDTVCKELRSMGREIATITPDQFRNIPCPTYPEIRLAIDAYWKLPGMLDALKPEAIHIATEGPLGYAARRYCRKRGLPFTTSFHTKFPEYLEKTMHLPTRWSYAVLRWFHRPAKAVLVATQSMRDELAGYGFTNCMPWSRGVDTSLFHPNAPGENHLDFPRPIWLYVGRISAEKNLEAFLSLEMPGTKILVGDGPQFEQTRKKFPNAIYPGAKFGEELRRYYASADVFVFPSKFDTFGLVMIEALGCGTPVAAYPVTGPRDVILDPKAGILREDLRAACDEALTLKRDDCVAYAQRFSWRRCAEIFAGNLAMITR